jgi:hypothetical protein
MGNLDFSNIDDFSICYSYTDFNGFEDFCEFLVYNGVIDDYIRYFYDMYFTRYGIKLNEFLMKHKPKNYIDSAFVWPTDEVDKWLMISKKWARLVGNNM